MAVQTLVSGGVETDDRYFVFGSYIDEVLVMHDGTGDLYYAHDHLYSPVALLAANGTVDELADALKWFKADQRREGPHAWKVAAKDVLQNGCNLDIKNPRSQEALEHLPAEELAESIVQKTHRVAQIDCTPSCGPF